MRRFGGEKAQAFTNSGQYLLRYRRQDFLQCAVKATDSFLENQMYRYVSTKQCFSEHTGFPIKIIDLVMNYYENLKRRITSRSPYSNWHTIERRIIPGPAISARLFNLALNLTVKSTAKECRSPVY